MSKRYAKIKEDGRLQYFNGRSVVRPDGGIVFNPRPDTLLSLGYLEVPKTDADKYVTSWSVVDGALVPTYNDVPPPELPKTYSKYKIISTLMKIGKWDVVEKWIRDNTNYFYLFMAANEFNSEDDNFKAAVPAIAQLLGMELDEVNNTILENCRII